MKARELLQLALIVGAVSAATGWWASKQHALAGEAVAQAAKPGDIRMLSSQTCGVCSTARQWFTEHRVPFAECVIERDAACRAEFQARGATGTPLILVRGQQQLGFSPEAIRARLAPG